MLLMSSAIEAHEYWIINKEKFIRVQKIYVYPGAWTGIFPCRGGFLEQGDFDEYLIYNIWKKETAGKKFIVFPWHYWNCILNEKFNFSWIQTRLFSQNQGTFCKFQKRTGKTSCPSPCISWLFSGNESLTVNANPLSWKN